MKKLLITVLFVLPVLVNFPLVATAQQQETPREMRIGPLSELERQLVFARNLVRERNFEMASALLEVIHEKDPENEIALNLLKQCYAELKYYTKSEDLIRSLVEKQPGNLAYQLDLAEVLVYQGKKNEGLEAYQRAMTLVPNNDSTRFLMVINSMINSGLDDNALTLIDSIRVLENDSLLYGLQRGAIFEKHKKYRAAALEYFPLLEKDTTRTAIVAERNLFNLLDFVESSKEVEQALLEKAGPASSLRVMKLLSGYYIKIGEFDKAFDFTVRLDSLDEEAGNSLLYYMRRCRERRQFEQVLRMGDYLRTKYTEPGPITGEAVFLYAEALTESGRYPDAIAVYREIKETFPQSRDKAEAFYFTGRIYLEYLGDYPRALSCFDSVITNYRTGFGYLGSLRSVPVCYMRLQEFDTAREKYQALLQNRLNDDILEEAQYNLALIDFYRGSFDSTSTALHKLIVDFPRGFYVNDALKLILVIDEAKGAPALLGDYARAHWFEAGRMLDSTRTRLERIAADENKALADIALFHLAELNLQSADTVSALGFIDRLINNFPDSYYLPFGMKTRADILVKDKNTREEARDIYRFLLENYPNYPFISDVRESMRRLEADFS
ncbi:MAG: tetratricopeptide repeat protein [candidate division Zixibacteria bacterium]|nr:tetratricopeptide repeat protein [candidate division Zixibacteria bacterium]